MVTSPVLGASSVAQIEDLLKVLEWRLSAESLDRLDRASEQPPPRYPYRFINRFN